MMRGTTSRGHKLAALAAHYDAWGVPNPARLAPPPPVPQAWASCTTPSALGRAWRALPSLTTPSRGTAPVRAAATATEAAAHMTAARAAAAHMAVAAPMAAAPMAVAPMAVAPITIKERVGGLLPLAARHRARMQQHCVGPDNWAAAAPACSGGTLPAAGAAQHYVWRASGRCSLCLDRGDQHAAAAARRRCRSMPPRCASCRCCAC